MGVFPFLERRVYTTSAATLQDREALLIQMAVHNISVRGNCTRMYIVYLLCDPSTLYTVPKL